MPAQAKVTAIDALDIFRAVLINYVAKARPTLEEVTAEVVRLRAWLEGTQRTYWENEAKKRRRIWEEAQQALFSAKLSNLRRESAAEVAAVTRARRAMEEADEKLRRVKRWAREFDSRVQPLVKQMEKLHTMLANDLIQAAAHLAGAVETLSAYAEKRPLLPPTPNAPAPETDLPAPVEDLTPSKPPA
jgi:hypothetical protein